MDRHQEAIQMMHDGAFERAKRIYLEILDQEKNPKYLYNLSICHQNLNEINAAVFVLKECLDLDSGYLDAWANLSSIQYIIK